MRLALDRLRRRRLWGLPVPDLALAGVLCLVAAASVLTGNPAEGPIALTLPVAVATTLALAWRRRSPVVALAVIAAAGLLQALLAQSPGSLWSLAVYAIAVYSLAAWSTEGVAAIAGAAFVAVLLVQERLDNGVDYVFILLLFGGVWLLGRASRHWRGRVSAADERQREAARLAVAEERVRIARDLHDVVAHSLGAIAVQADAAEAALQLAPDRAVTPVRVIRQTAREALTDIRGVLDMLRGGEDDVPGVASPAASAVAGLVDSARAAGMRIELDLRLTDGLVPPAVDLACYRIVQESLTNARKHAPGAAVSIAVVQARRELRVEIRSSAAAAAASSEPSGRGYGIRGMRERVRELGGSLEAGPEPGGGFAVRAAIPLPAGRRA